MMELSFLEEQFLHQIYLENNEDDSVDWTEGWNGTLTNTYISHTVAGFSTAFEGDKEMEILSL